ncbi:DUF2271 domain-containing protein [Motilimonas pumila]|uniref:DUF2271 domain-containing protein n=1 Tax=Motilimonas pumila TaxID=2303987 RepID=A0A418YF28_9GAMM|nr:DUF2271 domain-containing protein [Motilimonas pumila]RJG47752.1 DUF2271 domain-containing protein [Motilimonas pumila]
MHFSDARFIHRGFVIMALFVAAFTMPAAQAEPLPTGATFSIALTLPELNTTMYARPYVAIWVENSERKVVKNISLWTGRQTEWLKDIRTWWRKFGRYHVTDIDGYSSATKPAGDYTIRWDGKSEQDDIIAQGDYTLFIEVVREHGGRDVLKQAMTLADKSQSWQLPAAAEVGPVTIHYQVGQ